jgi:hypothetical protein
MTNKPTAKPNISLKEELFAISNDTTSFTVKIDYKNKYASAQIGDFRLDNITTEQLTNFVNDIFKAHSIVKSSLNKEPQHLSELKFGGC